MPRKGTTSQRGYGQTHQKIRKQYAALVATGNAVCWRCGKPITPDMSWDLGHDDVDRSKYKGPEHALAKDCPMGGNRATAGRRNAKHYDTSRDW